MRAEWTWPSSMNYSVKFLEPTLSVCAEAVAKQDGGGRFAERCRPFRRGCASGHSGRMIVIESITASPPCVHRRIARRPSVMRAIEDGATARSKSGGLSNRQCCYGRRLSISALSAASIVRYDASTAITRDPASAIQPVWPTRSISAHCSESSRAPRIELVPLIICAARGCSGHRLVPLRRAAPRERMGSDRGSS
jgi:hypothetical protein